MSGQPASELPPGPVFRQRFLYHKLVGRGVHKGAADPNAVLVVRPVLVVALVVAENHPADDHPPLTALLHLDAGPHRVLAVVREGDDLPALQDDFWKLRHLEPDERVQEADSRVVNIVPYVRFFGVIILQARASVDIGEPEEARHVLPCYRDDLVIVGHQINVHWVPNAADHEVPDVAHPRVAVRLLEDPLLLF